MAPPLVRLIGDTCIDMTRCGCAITLLEQASLVPLMTLKHPRLGSDICAPNSGLLLPWNIVERLVVPTNLWIIR
jgi:hypothetical protein